ncbi:MAG: 5'-3' exonuclease H3TH domain-containing protein [Candidatus Peregrinibacteria bacterium]
MKKLMLIDGNAIIHRAFHALPPFKTSKGELVNAVYGFASILLHVLANFHPEHIAVSFDLKGKTFRHEEYKEYKATRHAAPDELYEQIPRIKELVRSFEIPIYEVEGFEADDVLGTLAAQAEKELDIMTYIYTGDMDTLQLVTSRTNVVTPGKGLGEPVIYGPQKVLGKYGINPSQVPDMKGLQGDSSDNIKGVAGIGPKTTKILLQKYGTLENIYENIGEITGKVHDNLEHDRENAFFSRKLATIVKDVPICLDLPACRTHKYDRERVEKLFEELEFKTLIRRLDSFNNHSENVEKTEDSKQPSLF